MSNVWKVLQTSDAKQDYANIIRWTANNFGSQQTRIYGQNFRLAFDELKTGPTLLGVKKRGDLGADIHTLHIARKGRKGRHFIVFRVVKPNAIEVLRVLHDSMDLAARLVE